MQTFVTLNSFIKVRRFRYHRGLMALLGMLETCLALLAAWLYDLPGETHEIISD